MTIEDMKALRVGDVVKMRSTANHERVVTNRRVWFVGKNFIGVARCDVHVTIDFFFEDAGISSHGFWQLEKA